MLCQCIKCIVPRNYSTIDADNSIETEANSQQNTQTQLMANKINVKGDRNKFDHHFGQVKRSNAATKRRDANTYEGLITIQPKKIRKTPIASHRQNCSKKSTIIKKLSLLISFEGF